MNENLYFDQSAEMCALGSCIIAERAVAALKGMGVTRDSFFLKAHQAIWEAIEDLETVDLVTISHWLRNHEKLDFIGGEDYLIQVAEEVPSAANAEFYAKLVLEAAHRRRLAANAQKLLNRAGHEPQLAVLASLADNMKLDLASFMPRGQSLSDVEVSAEVLGLSTGFPELDKMTSAKGHPLGQVTIVAAPAKGGKTTLMLDMFLHDLRGGRNVCYGTFADLDAGGIKKRLIRKLCGRETPPEEPAALAEFKKAVAWLDGLDNGRLYDGFATEDDSVEAFAGWVEAQHRKRPFQKVYVDYAQELRSTSKAAAYSPEQNQAECARILVRLARRLGIAVIVGSQVTEAPREGQKAKTKWSRAWEEKAGWVLVITNYEDLGPFLEITYSRFGPQSGPKHTVGAAVKRLGDELAFVARE